MNTWTIYIQTIGPERKYLTGQSDEEKDTEVKRLLDSHYFHIDIRAVKEKL